MEKDLTANVKSLAMGIVQYRSSLCQTDASHVLKHIDALLGGLDMTQIDRLFNAKNVIGTQCLTEMEKLITDKSTNSHLLSKVIEFFNSIATVHDVRIHLQNSFDLSNTLYGHVAEFGKEEKYSHIIPHVLVLLGKLTYKLPVNSSSTFMGKVLEFLLQEIDDDDSEMLHQSMMLLNHLVYNNISTQIQVKSLLSVNRIRRLMQLLKQVSTQSSILALSILTLVFWKDDIGKKLYRGQNWFKAMKIIFHTLFDDNNLEAQIIAGDLCIELLNYEEVSQQIAMYEEEHGCINMLFDRLDTDTPAASKILEVLLKFSDFNLVKSSLCRRIFENNNKCWKTLLKVATRSTSDLGLPVDHHPAILALTLVREICEEIVESATPSSQEWMSDLFVLINSSLLNSSYSDVPKYNFLLHKILKTIQLVSSVFSEDETFQCVAKDNIEWHALNAILEDQMTHNLTGIVSTQPEWSNTGVHVVVSTLELMMMAKDLLPSIAKDLFHVLQDVRMIPFFVSAISSPKSIEIQSVLRLFQEGSSLPDFPIVLLAEKLADVNKTKRNLEYVASPVAMTSGSHSDRLKSSAHQTKKDIPWSNLYENHALESLSVMSLPSSSSSDDKENLDALATKIHHRANSERKLFGKTAQILDVYEQKITSLQTKESHLQDLLDAKSLALSQADRVIARHRCQQSQLEEESKKLAQMLRESETRREHLHHDMQAIDESRQETEKELESTVEENRELQKIAEKYDSLQVAFNDKLHRIEVQERNLATQKQEFDTLREMHDMFQKHNEKLKAQVNEGVFRLEQLEDQKLQLLKQSGDKQAKIHELERLVMDTEKAIRRHMNEKAEQEVLNKSLESSLRKSEEEAKNLKMRIGSLERSVKQAEHQLKEKGAEIKKLHQGNAALEEQMAGVMSEKRDLGDEVVLEREKAEQLKVKLETMKQTLVMITQLSAELPNSQG